ncbi:adenosylcobinamide amidohydrolase [Halopolyspora algeriensis]|uniref:Adenosylcobinamide amidohydrolase n=1 Tax=Halopolyspora algeriensis TaxID=1500506 RepID=A0A368VEP6_9ACTN|nr:adenosylcobinamide amidohydrolase [Halopolyspora algeriensis]RCW39173.1 adenosylcobinamide amidohydrolase [Halopolyspora algeriensis]TQM47459.1 adenosylcobinamide amidohydrolase [Halopolyspora algeriensis]
MTPSSGRSLYESTLRGAASLHGVALHRVQERPVLVWRGGRSWLAASSAPHGGGIGQRRWVLNATVGSGYDRSDPAEHVTEMAGELGLTGNGVGMLTAVDVRHEVTSIDSGVQATVTTGVGFPIWAAEAPVSADEHTSQPGTINALCWSPVRLSEAALINAVATVAEAKAQALVQAGVEGTGTCTDATVVLCPLDGDAESYGGPRSRVGSALARTAHAAITAGLRVDNPRYRDCD